MSMTPIHLDPCRPPFWARSAHLQTILGSLIPSRVHHLEAISWQVEVSDGDHLSVRYVAGRSRVVVYLWHGLGGHAATGYMRRSARIANRLGHHVVQANHRGCGEGSQLAGLPYHSGRWRDLEAVLIRGQQELPGMRHLVIGFSLSGNALLLLLSQSQAVMPDFAISVNAPIDLAAAADRISSGFPNRLYDLRFVRGIRQSVRRRQRTGVMPQGYRIPAWATLKQVDDLLTAPACGFADKEDYYLRCSTRDRLSRIRTPTLLLTSRDDPMVPFEAYARAELSPTTLLHAESIGGHMGYLSARNGSPGWYRWLDHAIEAGLRYFLDDR